ncbi:VOC family protein [Corynebacterium crudilactis]|uniref:Glyoxalase n=1 Tax=Corynebacterium crudilactis TaxID=1652495 RepID=A0A172QSI2_9CORY|nr:VOC family protein [Corynebacterium crudilactis]ANE03649.1 glyoxalase [Corynebacterium crudilactis]
MSRPIHFEIHSNDVPKAATFYADIFGWTYEDYSAFAGMPYFGILTGSENEPGINGALTQRKGTAAAAGGPINGAVLTMGVEDFDACAEKILTAGGTVALEKYALPGMAWQGYFLDLDGNVFGIHQPDHNAG